LTPLVNGLSLRLESLNQLLRALRGVLPSGELWPC